MNKIFNGKFLAILIAVIALLGGNLVSAKDYSVTAGNYQVDFKSNDTLYTEVVWNPPADGSSLGYYTLWIKEDPGALTTRSGAIELLEYTYPTPFGKDSLRGWMRLFFSSFNETPILSDSLIDGTDAVIAEGWNASFGRIVYGAIYPIDKDSYGTAQKSVGFLSLLDRKTNFEILNSLHVKYTDSAQAQTPATTITKERVNQGGSQGTVQPMSANSGIAEPYVLIKCQGNLYNKIGQYTEADPGKAYLVTNLQIENHGYDEFNVNPNYVKVEINKVQYDYSWVNVGDLGLASLDSVTLRDGGITTGAVAFKIPSNSDQYALVWKTWAWDSYNVKIEYVK